MHDTGTPHTHESEDDQNSAPATDPKTDHDTNHQDKKVDGCEFC